MTQNEMNELETYAASILEDSYEARKVFDFCKVFNYALPILKPIANFYFMPKRIKKILNDLIFVGEQVCPSPDTTLIALPDGVSKENIFAAIEITKKNNATA